MCLFAEISIVNKTCPRKDWHFFHVWILFNNFHILSNSRPRTGSWLPFRTVSRTRRCPGTPMYQSPTPSVVPLLYMTPLRLEEEPQTEFSKKDSYYRSEIWHTDLTDKCSGYICPCNICCDCCIFLLIGLALGQSASPRFGPKPITKSTLRHHI